MDVADLLTFTGISVMLTLMPGPDILFVIAQSVTHSSSIAFQVLKWAGALYLFILAWQALRETDETGNSTEPPVRRQRFASLYRRGILMNLLNPKVSLFFLAFFPQFVSPDAGSVSWQMAVLGAVFMAQALLVFTSVSVIRRNILKSATLSKWVNRTKAGIYALLGARLVFMERE